MNIDECVGYNIRKYRKAHQMTLEELALRINKSKSTVSKYEKGIISLDVATLAEISDCFQISLSQLLVGYKEDPLSDQKNQISSDTLYMYTYDGRQKRLQKSVMERYYFEERDSTYTAVQLFYDTPNVREPQNCKALYSGKYSKTGFIETYFLQNQNHSCENVLISCIDNLSCSNKLTGLVTGLSSKTMLPTTLKTLISPVELKEDQALISSLLLSKEDFKLSKKYNQFTLEHFSE